MTIWKAEVMTTIAQTRSTAARGSTKFSNCDRARDLVTKLGVSFKNGNVPNSADKVSLKIGSTTVEGFDAARWTAAFLDAGYPNLQHDKDGKVVPKPADTTKVNWLMTELILVIMVILHHHGLRPGCGVPGRIVSGPDPLHVYVAAL